MVFNVMFFKHYDIIGLVCNANTKRWEWADGTADDYRPSDGYHPGTLFVILNRKMLLLKFLCVP